MNITKKIEFTKEAIKQIENIVLEIIQKNTLEFCLGGGCSGFKYNFTFEEKPQKDDIVFNKNINRQKFSRFSQWING